LLRANKHLALSLHAEELRLSRERIAARRQESAHADAVSTECSGASIRFTSPTRNTYEKAPISATIAMNARPPKNEPVAATMRPMTIGVTMPARFVQKLKMPPVRPTNF